MNHLEEVTTVKETDHLVPYVPQIKGAVFGLEALFLDWRGHHQDEGTQRSRLADGVLWMPAEPELWLIELEWELGSNYLDQVKTFSENRLIGSTVKTLRGELTKSVENSPVFKDALGSVGIKHTVDYTFEKYARNNVLRPNIWVVLGHDEILSIVGFWNFFRRRPATLH